VYKESQLEFAKRLGIQKTNYCEYEKGRELLVGAGLKIAGTLGTTAGKIWPVAGKLKNSGSCFLMAHFKKAR